MSATTDTAAFQVVLTDGTTHTKGDTTTAFAALGADQAQLESLREEGDWLVLEHSDGWEIAVPEARIARVIGRGL